MARVRRDVAERFFSLFLAYHQLFGADMVRVDGPQIDHPLAVQVEIPYPRLWL